MKRNRIYMILLFICMTVLGGCQEKPQIQVQEAEVSEDTKEAGEQKNKASEQTIYVQVSGAVSSPGVYELSEGSRVFEAVELAGGMTEEADAGQMNQAQSLSDGQMVYIPRQGETQAQEAAGAVQEDGRVNLNTATEEQLMTLPGIGQAKASSIIKWREENDGFTKVEDLMQIEGIKEGVFSKIRDNIKVN